MQLQDKIALVTGGSRGIGKAIALGLASEGAEVIVHYNSNESAAESVVREITESGGKATFIGADISDLGDIERLFDETRERYPHFDILVNNAGWADFKPLAEADVQHFDEQFNLNVRGLFFLTQHALKRLNDGGRIVNISSGITRANVAGGSAYAATKAAIEAMTRCWAAELGSRGITVNTVSPGMTKTDLLHAVTPPEVLEAAARDTLLGRLGEPQDVADVVVFLCTEKARWLTAQNLLANGGMS